MTWQADGTLSGGVQEPNYGDVISASAAADKIQGLGGNDALDGNAGDDQIEGGDGDDLIGGGPGSDRILGGAGNDTILTATGLTVLQRVGPSDTFTLPAGASVRSIGPGWAVYNIGPNLFISGGAMATSTDGDVVDGGIGNDIIIGGLGADRIIGGEGNDYVEGHGGDDVIEGNDGNDVLLGDGYTAADYGYRSVSADTHGVDFIDGGAGNDIIVGGGNDDALYGGAGDDTIAGDTNGDGIGQPGWLAGQYQGDDYIDGEDGNDILAGDGGDDTIYGGSGDDVLAGDRDQSQVAGEFHGNDYLDGEEGNDLLYGGGKDDVLYGGAGNDRLDGDGVDIAGQFHGNDYLDGGDGDDTLIGGGKDDVLYGGAGNDQLLGDDEPDRLGAEFAGNDYLDGGDGDDYLSGGGGNDTLIGGAGKNYLDGGEGDDTYVVKVGDTIHDSGGKNTISIAGGAPTVVKVQGNDLVLVIGTTPSPQQTTPSMRLMSAAVSESPDSLVIESAFLGGGFALNGTALDDAFFDQYDVTLVTTADNQNLSTWDGNDTLTAEHDHAVLDGRGGDDVLIGGTGSNTLYGRSGDDILVSRGQSDTLDGGEGNDTFRIEAQAGVVTIAADTQTGNDTVVFAGSSATTGLTATIVDEDVIIHSTRAVTAADGTVSQVAGATLHLSHYVQGGSSLSSSISAITFQDGGAISLSQLLASSVVGGATDDTLDGGLFVDHIDGGAGNDQIHGGAGNDILIGGTGNDRLFGNSGKDTLEGGDGNDILRGGYGSDILRGGAGDDTYVFGNEAVPSVSADLEIGQQVDVIEDTEGANIISFEDGAKLDSVSFVRISDSLSTLFFNGQKIEIHGATSGFMVHVDGYTRTLESFTQVVEPPPVDPRLTQAQQAFLASSEAAATSKINGEVLAGLFAANTDSTSSLWKHVNSNDSSVAPVALTFSGYVASQAYGVLGYRDSAGHALTTDVVSGEFLGVLSSVTSFGPLQTKLADQGKNIEVISMSPSAIYLGPDQLELGGWRHGQVIGWAWTGHDKSLMPTYGTYTYHEYVTHKDAHAGHVVLGDAANTLSVGAAVVHAGGGNDNISVGEDWLSEAHYNGLDIGLFLGAAATFVDGGDGDDTISGSDLDDVLLGGRGHDVLRGGSGGDRYLVLDYGQSSDDEDVIADTGVSGVNTEGLQIYFGNGAFDKDTVEFGPGIALEDLYFLRETVDENGRPVERLVAVRDGRRLVSIDVGDAQLPGSGVEYLQFDGGRTISFDEALVRARVAAPLIVGVAADANLLEDGVFNYSVGGLFTGGTGAVAYTAKLADGSALPGWLSFDRATGAFTGTLVNEPATSFVVNVTATDRAGATGSVNFSIGIESVNDAPVVDATVIDQAAFQDEPFVMQLGEDLFSDVDVGDTLSWGVQLSDGRPLPAWLSFDPATRKLSGTPVNADAGWLDLQIVVTDGASATATQRFRMSVTETQGIDITGSAGADNLTGSAGDDHIDGLGRADVMTGGDGDDVYVVDNTRDVVIETPNHGYDRIESQVTYTLPADVEALTLKGTRSLAATGNTLDNVLIGNSGSNFLDGRQGNDTMTGGAGNDVYEVESAGDQVIERDGEGTDTVESTISYTLPVNVERLSLLMPGLTGTGNALANRMTTNAGGGTLYGLGGNDDLRGGAGSDVLLGGDGNDRLDGGDGSDQMEGGAGNDVYFVSQAGDAVIEQLGEGTDTVYASVSFTLSSNVENLILSGTDDLQGTGNELANTIVGNGGANVLSGMGGNDRLRGGAGADRLLGGDGNDRLDGGAGADQLAGGTGNDTYIVEDAGDVVEELANEGTDTVQSSVSFSLGANVENLTLTGAGILIATGNELNNALTANAAGSTLDGLGGNDTLKGAAGHDVLLGGEGNDRLDGGASADRLVGGAGNDVYVVDELGDEVVENAGEGTDTVQTAISYTLGANVENLTLTGSASLNGTGNDLANVITGTDGGGRLSGLAGNDTLKGGDLGDLLIGGTGNDRLEGGLGGDGYEFGRGDGQDMIVESDATAGVLDTLHFDAGIDASQLWWRKTGNNLEVSVIGSTDKVTISNWYLGSARHVEVFELANGQQLLDTQVQALVQAMASFAPPAAGQTSLPSNYQSSLQPVIAASWH